MPCFQLRPRQLAVGKRPRLGAYRGARERHAVCASPWQRTRTYTDGLGRVAMTKTQAEPGQAWTVDVGAPQYCSTPRRRCAGWALAGTVYNNKGLPVELYVLRTSPPLTVP